jgi:hypothetical protein
VVCVGRLRDRPGSAASTLVLVAAAAGTVAAIRWGVLGVAARAMTVRAGDETAKLRGSRHASAAGHLGALVALSVAAAHDAQVAADHWRQPFVVLVAATGSERQRRSRSSPSRPPLRPPR